MTHSDIFFFQSTLSRRVFSKIAPQNTSFDRWSPKSTILTPISLGNNDKFIKFGKKPCVCKKV